MRQNEMQVVHDMRNLATVIHGAAETLHHSRDTLPSVTVDHLTGMLARRSAMLVQLLADLSTLDAVERGDLTIRLQSVEIAAVLADIVESHRSTFAGELEVVVAADAVAVADPTRVSQILDNLLSNAARYGARNVTVRAWREDGTVRLEVADDGPGVNPALLDSLFDPYARSKGSTALGGTGLGLTIVTELAQAMSGTIEYRSDHGAVFTITLPATPVTPVPPGPDAARQGHTVAFWSTDAELGDTVSRYLTAGLIAGEACVMAVTPEHQVVIEAALEARGIDVAAARAIGQYLPLNAVDIHRALEVDGHIDPRAFRDIVGAVVTATAARWQTFRAFGEIVDLYWRDERQHLSLELEQCWNQLRAEISFPLYCGYELSADQGAVCDCHQAVVPI
jgi:anti-sigma regulatory factor (Ser/Thr protein kinase)